MSAVRLFAALKTAVVTAEVQAGLSVARDWLIAGRRVCGKEGSLSSLDVGFG